MDSYTLCAVKLTAKFHNWGARWYARKRLRAPCQMSRHLVGEPKISLIYMEVKDLDGKAANAEALYFF